MKNFMINNFIVICLFAFNIAASAHNNVVVIPLLGDESKPLQNVISVAVSNGDFTDPIAALASISDESENNPYLIVIGPGVYQLSEQLVMREYINIVGSGKGITRLIGSVSDSFNGNSSALVVGAANTTLSSLTVENIDGENGTSVGISCNGPSPVSPALIDLEILLSGGRDQTGLYTGNAASPTLESVDIILRDGSGEQSGTRSGVSAGYKASRTNILVENGGGLQRGIYSPTTGLITLNDSQITVRGGAGGQFGAEINDRSSLRLSDSSISLTNSGALQAGLRLASESTGTVTNSTIRVFDASEVGVGISRSSNSTAIVRGSTVRGNTGSVIAAFTTNTTTDYISDSILSDEPFGTNRCSFVFLEDGTPINNDCE